ncbi:hypothetical protein ACFQWB_07740 [Paenibacillus thermoaerophilus]|uniref:Uncharacterized protein n=1 Tax=Paenibacillus thermoaerophilus TaxID=1215385 RepID=A0ABW2V4M6_9BACL|nr:hypothetical protein [Paenibacillus thermoaerophilus]TMV13878.1 hypothetical protein FE781_11825 [Paenibacillus thermoaerophilus]
MYGSFLHKPQRWAGLILLGASAVLVTSIAMARGPVPREMANVQHEPRHVPPAQVGSIPALTVLEASTMPGQTVKISGEWIAGPENRLLLADSTGSLEVACGERSCGRPRIGHKTVLQGKLLASERGLVLLPEAPS